MSGYRPPNQRDYHDYSREYSGYQDYQAFRNHPEYQDYPGHWDYNHPPYPHNSIPTTLQNQPVRKIDWIGAIRKLSFAIMGSAAVAGALIGAGMLKSGTDFLGNLFAVVSQPQPEPKVDLRSAVVQQVRNVTELTTAIYEMETVVPTSRERTLGGVIVGKTTLLYVAHGEVRAGVDLRTLRAEDVQITGDQIFLRLPPPKILDSKIDVNRSHVYDYDRGFLGLGPDVAPELQQLAERKTLEKIVASACAGGLLQTASDRAKISISQLLTTAGYENFFVDIQPAAADACPSTLSEGQSPTIQPPVQPPADSVEPPLVPPSAQPAPPEPFPSSQSNQPSAQSNEIELPPVDVTTQ